MELSWLMKLRIAVSAAVGVVLVGIVAWPLAAASSGPFAPLSVQTGVISIGDALILAALAFLAGFVAYFPCRPWGREIGVLAVPAGLAVWAVRGGNMTALLQLNPSLAQHQELFAALKWEPFFWLAIVAAGFGGVLAGEKILPNPEPDKAKEKPKPKSEKYLNAAIAVVGSVLIAQFCISAFAQGIKIPDSKLGSVTAQPSIGQIVFAVLVSFAIAAFIVKKFLNLGYIWPTIASALVTAFAVSIHIKEPILQHLGQNWPAVFFSNSITSILPLQIVTFGTLGSIWGYWLAVRYDYWREHEN